MGISSRFFKPNKLDKEEKDIYIAGIFLAVAGFFDYRRGKIPNVLILAELAVVFWYRFYEGAEALWLWRAMLVFVLLYPLFKIGAFGAGDVKLFCLTAALLEQRECFLFVCGSFGLAALAGMVKLLSSRSLRERAEYFVSYLVSVLHQRKLRLYWSEGMVEGRATLHMAGPMLAALLLQMGYTLWTKGGIH